MPGVHHRPRFPAAVVTGPVTPIVATAKPTVVKPTVVKPTTPLPVTKTPAQTTKVIPPTTKATAPIVVPTKPTVPVTPSSVIIPPTLPLTISSTTTTSSTSVIPISTIPTSKSTLASPSSAANTVAAKGSAVARVSPSVSASPSTSSVPSTSSSTSVPAVAVGIIGGLVGVVLTGVLVAFFFRRWNRRSRIRDSINFDAKNFRRSAIMLESPRPPQEPDFGRGGGSIRSVPMDYHHTPPVVHQQYPYMHAPPTTYTPNTPSYPAADYAIPANPFYSPPAYQGYPPDLNRGSFQNGSHPVAAPPPPPPAPQQQYYHDNHDDAYGGM
ncbi:hypothetical protein DFH06DRAFT_1442688 [Mycena polygramma]|nr:hypothetical protein DFH06DRAFT_1442688 [Mycena polygramma]